MSSINFYYTFDYSQPEAYHFSHDSVFLARRVFEHLRNELSSDWRVLDLCSGCGIVGLDFLFHCKKELNRAPRECDFLEVQSVYESHFEINRARLQQHLPDIQTRTRFLNQNYRELAFEAENLYDLILCNPPYFNPSEGLLSPSEFKNRCRFFIDGSRQQLISAIENSLSPNGCAYVLTRNAEALQSSLQIHQEADIRGTQLIKLLRI